MTNLVDMHAAVGEVAMASAPDRWFKCEHPEQPGDDHTIYLWDCDACVIGLIADARDHPEMPSTSRDGDGQAMGSARNLRDTLALALAYRRGEGLPELGGAA